jgi:NDP-sugar pyrophosphorylase family protein
MSAVDWPGRSVTGVLLAAGRGKRLRPYTDRTPKSLLPIRGEPLLDYHLRLLESAGIRRLVLVLGYRGREVREHVEDRWPDLSRRTSFVEQDPPRGTGDALRRALRHVRTPWVLVAYSDVYWGPSPRILRRLLSGPAPRLVGAFVPDASEFGRLELRPGPRHPQLEGVAEKDGRATPGWVNAGLYLLPRDISRELRRTGVSPRGEIELPEAIVRRNRRQTFEVLRTRTWWDIGTPARWDSAQGEGR